MKIVEGCGGLITNVELLHVLKEKGAAEQTLKKAHPSERKVYEYLAKYSPDIASDRIQAFLEAAKEFDLTKAEMIQLINVRMTGLVDICMVVEDCEERLGEERSEELLKLVQSYFGPAEI